jgi:hypothetical protein
MDKDYVILDDFIQGKYGFCSPIWEKIKKHNDIPQWFRIKYRDYLKDE